jgi:hypothetical protein
MKKVISISLTILMLIALLHFSVATHYCMGKIAATKISLSGELATCGMESDENIQPQTGTHFTSHCCDNVLVYCGINVNYFPSFSIVPESCNSNFQVFNIPASFKICSISTFKSINTGVRPPGISASSNVDLRAICVFRI